MEIENQEQDTQLEPENQEQEIILDPEFFTNVGDGVLTIQENGTDLGTFSANQSEDTTINIPVPTTTSELTNDANFQNANDVSNAISAHNQSSSSHQDIRQAITDEATTRLNADNGLQGQIDAITSSSDVVDIVGTYAELEAYDTQHLKDNDVIKVLQDETHNDAMTYWRWSTHTETWTYIGAEGPYYTKSETNTLLDEKLDVDEVPDGFFDGPATITPTEGTSIEIEGGLKLKSVNLKGDTTQQTYTGKNKVDFSTVTFSSANDGSGTRDGNTLTVSGNNYDNWGGIQFKQTYLNLEPNTTYTFSAKVVSTENQNGSQVWIASNMSSTGSGIGGTVAHSGEISQATFTTPNTISNDASIRLYPKASNISAVFTDLQLEKGSTATSYEPYVGGIASPNPDYPQNVNVVTGTQTITLTDGTISEDYTVDLGSTELCKIGTYQDYIYKSGDDWYVHKEIGKVVIDGSDDEDWAVSLTGTPNFFYRYRYVYYGSNQSAFSNYFSYKIITSSDTDAGFYMLNTNQVRFRPDFNELSLTDWKTWLSTHNTTVYYILATPTDTKITDQTLIGQLNAVLNSTLYQPNTTISSSGNLPAILGIVAYTEHLNSLLEIASEPLPTPVTYSDFTGTDGNTAGTSGLVPAPSTTDAGKFLKADGTWDTAGGGSTVNVVQTTGTSQTDVMSQNATTSMVFTDPSTRYTVLIGNSIGSGTPDHCVGIGHNVYAAKESVCIGENAGNGHDNTVSIGRGAKASGRGSIAIGDGTIMPTGYVRGTLSIYTSSTGYGYNGASNYRLITGVYDGQNAHDAVTVGQVNATIDAINTALGTSIPHIGA